MGSHQKAEEVFYNIGIEGEKPSGPLLGLIVMSH
jgi:hypothetical protein